jgi:uncharacterized beta-barrel protein YwiB (DUF1934 family)
MLGTGNTFEVRDGGTAVLSVLDGGNTTITANGGSNIGLTVNNGTSTGNILQIQDNGTNVLTVTDGGNLNYGNYGARTFTQSYNSTNTTAADEFAQNTTVSDTGIVTSGNDNTWGHYINVTRTGATGGSISAYGLDSVVTADLAGAGTSGAYAVNATAQNGDYSTGVNGRVNFTTTGTMTQANALQAMVYNQTTGTITTANGLSADMYNVSTGTITNAFGISVNQAVNSGGGVITNNYGIYVATQTAGTTDYGIRVDAADTQTLWLSGNADNTTAAAGIAFGASRDTNLYRSAADTLKTDDNLVVAQDATVSSQLAVGSTSSISTREVISVDETFTNTSGDSIGISNVITHNPGSASTAGIYGNWTEALTADGNTQSTSLLVAGRNQATHQGDGDLLLLYGAYSYGNVNYLNGGGTVTLGVGDYGRFENWGAATVTNASGVYGESNLGSAGSIVNNNALAAHAYNSGSGNITNNKGLYVLNELQSTGNITTNYGIDIASVVNSGSGSITTNYGINVQAQTAGASDYGIRVDAADTQTLWLSGNADNTTAAAGIAFGASRDTNLYRSAADTLKTDDNLVVAQDATVSSQLAVGSTSSISTREVISVDETFTNTSGDSIGISNVITHNPGSASTAGIYGNWTEALTADGNTQSTSLLVAGRNQATHQGDGDLLLLYGAYSYGNVNYLNGGGTVTLGVGDYGRFENWGAATVTNAAGVYGESNLGSAGSIVNNNALVAHAYNNGSGNITNNKGLYVLNELQSTGNITTNYGIDIASVVDSGLGSITTNYGINVQAQTAGTSDYGIARPSAYS